MTSTDSYATDSSYSLVQGALATLRPYNQHLTSTTLKIASHTGSSSLHANTNWPREGGGDTGATTTSPAASRSKTDVP